MNTELSARASEIAACARALLVRGGYNGFSYADISTAVQISKASVHHHFPSKAELVRTVVARYREEARAGLDALSRQVPDPLARLQAYTGYWASCMHDDSSSFCICAMLASELSTVPREVADEVRGHFLDLTAWLASVLASGAAQGRFVLHSSPESEAMGFVATVHGAMLSARAYGDPEAFNAVVQPLLRRLAAP
jgi:TetR/AcrR family transcriptional regulator, transcriptional repressor for nem operon